MTLSLLIIPAYSGAVPSALFSAASAESELTVRAAADTGLLYGKIQEYVYSSGKDISRLDWEIMPLIYTGFSLCAAYGNYSLAFGLWSGINYNAGNIEDFDWENGDSTLTHYSKHDSILEKALFTDINLSYIDKYSGRFSIIYRAGFTTSTVKMAAVNGYLEYPPGSEKVDLYGTGITYEQALYAPYAGLGIDLPLTGKVSVSANVNFSIFAWCASVDNHLNRNLIFYDNVYSAIFLHAETSITYTLIENIRLRLAAAYTLLPETKGSSYAVNTLSGTRSAVYENSAGTSLAAMQIKISAEALVYH